MKPIYFPFTYISRQTAQAVSTYFKTIVVYQASAKPLPSEMQALAASGFLDVRVPDPSEQSRFDDVVKNLRSWGNLHFNNRGMKTAFSRSAREPVPFFNDSATSQIVADVKDELHPKQAPRASDARFDARIFIEFAQEFDRQSHEINHDLGTYDEKLEHLFADIKGAGDHPAAHNLSGSDNSRNNSAEYLILRRLEAWTHLFEQDAAESGIFFTNSGILMEHILDNIPSAEKIHTYECAPGPGIGDETFHLWQHNLITKLTSLVKAGRPASTDMPVSEIPADSGEPHISLSIFLIPDLKPLDWLSACISKPFSRSGNQIPASLIRNTVIGLIEHLGVSITPSA